MEAYMMFPKEKEWREMEMTSGDEQEEDIGCPSESELSLESSSESVDIADDASSSGSSSAGHFEMSSLMTVLPLKRGLSKFFDGKSQSFTSLAAVGGLEDLAKPMTKRLKTSRSCGAVRLQDAHRRGCVSRRLCHNASAASFKKASSSRGQLSVLGASRRTRPPVTVVSPRPQVVVPGQALLFA
ncbi:hypothetical protein GUJ93_ZPchr0004g39855 [Zizania palustris]|uniref:Oxidative stress 3 n=1 Tax=Zizania palustris TaxID=103762 RepID=A0A8J5SIA5_ZIZPA|nr:hypothetical protein GUJ93_ZPchr0004g39855 [Zizania palustris]